MGPKISNYAEECAIVSMKYRNFQGNVEDRSLDTLDIRE